VTAPSDSVAGTTAMFRVTAQSLESPYANDEVVLTATVREVHDFTLSIPNATRSLDPGQSTRFAAFLTNAGNIAETANLTAADVPEGWVVDIWNPNITLAPWTDNFVIIAVYAPAWALAGDYSLSVNGIGLDITVNARFRVEAAVGNASATAYPGETVTFNLTVFNGANAPDGFALAVGDLPAGWPGALIGQLGMLAAGANGTVTVTVVVPKNATAGTYDLRLSVRSAGDANQTRVLPVQVTVLKKAAPPATTTEAFPVLPLLLIIIIIAVVVVVIFVAMRRKRPPAEAPQEPVPEQSSAQGPKAWGY